MESTESIHKKNIEDKIDIILKDSLEKNYINSLEKEIENLKKIINKGTLNEIDSSINENTENSDEFEKEMGKYYENYNKLKKLKKSFEEIEELVFSTFDKFEKYEYNKTLHDRTLHKVNIVRNLIEKAESELKKTVKETESNLAFKHQYDFDKKELIKSILSGNIIEYWNNSKKNEDKLENIDEHLKNLSILYEKQKKLLDHINKLKKIERNFNNSDNKEETFTFFSNHKIAKYIKESNEIIKEKNQINIMDKTNKID